MDPTKIVNNIIGKNFGTKPDIYQEGMGANYGTGMRNQLKYVSPSEKLRVGDYVDVGNNNRTVVDKVGQFKNMKNLVAHSSYRKDLEYNFPNEMRRNERFASLSDLERKSEPVVLPEGFVKKNFVVYRPM